jgi:hypothetical protein
MGQLAADTEANLVGCRQPRRSKPSNAKRASGCRFRLRATCESQEARGSLSQPENPKLELSHRGGLGRDEGSSRRGGEIRSFLTMTKIMFGIEAIRKWPN